MNTTKLCEKLARLLQAKENCKKSNNTLWENKHSANLAALLAQYMPCGGGFDTKTTLKSTSTGEKLVFNTAFHHMNESGYYIYWTHHEVIVTPSLQFGFSLRVTGSNKNDIKDYIAEVFTSLLTTTNIEGI